MNYSGAAFRPTGSYGIPGFDPDWETKPLRFPVENDEGFDRLELPLGEGETLPFACLLALSGSTTCTVTVFAPTNSSGGFYIQGLDDTSTYILQAYGADSFSTPTSGSWLVGVAGTLEGWSVLRIEGVVGAASAGLLRVTTSAGLIQPGSLLKGYRQHDSRSYGEA